MIFRSHHLHSPNVDYNMTSTHSLSVDRGKEKNFSRRNVVVGVERVDGDNDLATRREGSEGGARRQREMRGGHFISHAAFSAFNVSTYALFVSIEGRITIRESFQVTFDFWSRMKPFCLFFVHILLLVHYGVFTWHYHFILFLFHYYIY